MMQATMPPPSVTPRAERLVFEIDGFRFEVFPDEPEHAGFPHCHITGHGIRVTVDIKSGKIVAGDAGRRAGKIRKLVLDNQQELMAMWDATHPTSRQISN